MLGRRCESWLDLSDGAWSRAVPQLYGEVVAPEDSNSPVSDGEPGHARHGDPWLTVAHGVAAMAANRTNATNRLGDIARFDPIQAA